MATKKEIKAWLKENNYTMEQIDKFWEECCEVNNKCLLLKNNGVSWPNLTIYAIKQLPTLKEETIRKKLEKEQKEKEEQLRVQKEKEEKKYYEENFENIIVNKIDNKDKLTENELRRLLDFELETERIYGEPRRWLRSVSSIISLKDRTFLLNWDQGLTENIENEFFNQPYEVKPVKHEKVIIVTDWVKI